MMTKPDTSNDHPVETNRDDNLSSRFSGTPLFLFTQKMRAIIKEHVTSEEGDRDEMISVLEHVVEATRAERKYRTILREGRSSSSASIHYVSEDTFINATRGSEDFESYIWAVRTITVHPFGKGFEIYCSNGYIGACESADLLFDLLMTAFRNNAFN